jgi:hypothetical protein
MPQAVTAPDANIFRESIEYSIDVLKRSLQRLRQLAPQALSAAIEDEIETQIGRTEAELTRAEVVGSRLASTGVSLKQLDDGAAQKLKTLATVMDDTVRRNTIATATFGGVLVVIGAAKDARDVIESALKS